ncbi:MAG: hypothetical protein WCK86_22505 [Planctomycetia bacterium]
MSLLLVLPVVWVFGYSVCYSLGAVGFLSQGLTSHYWVQAFTGQRLAESVLYSLFIAAVVTGCSLCLSLCLVCWLDAWRKHGRLVALLCIPLSTPAGVMGFLVLQIFSRGGVLSRVLHHLGVCSSPDDFPVLVNDANSVGLILALISGTCPLLMLYFLRIWQTAKVDDYVQLATRLGAASGQALRLVAVPMLLRRSPGLLMLTFAWNFGTWEIPLLLGSQSPRMMSVLIQQSTGQYAPEDRPLAFVFSTVYLVIVGIATAIFVSRRSGGV